MSLDLIPLIVAGWACLSLLVYYFYFFNRLNLRNLKKESKIIPVSVIIAARNEKKNLERNLRAILTQDYPDFEVVVVNDGSWDGTKDLLNEYKKEFPHLKVVELNIEEQYRKGKKFALTMGIKAASHEQLLFTDADCYPNSSQWISAMVRSKNNRDIILGYSPLKKRTSPMGAIIAYETFHTAVQYFSYSLAGKTYMGVGRNLSYTKELFFKNKGFANHQHILSGDDDLFVQEVAQPKNVSVCYDPDGYMISEAPTGVFKYIRQKLRHMSTSKLYEGRYKRLLGYYALCQILFYAGLAGTAFFPHLWIYGAIILGVKWLVQYIVLFKPAKRLGMKFIAYFMPLYDLFFTMYLIFFALVKPFIKVKAWN